VSNLDWYDIIIGDNVRHFARGICMGGRIGERMTDETAAIPVGGESVTRTFRQRLINKVASTAMRFFSKTPTDKDGVMVIDRSTARSASLKHNDKKREEKKGKPLTLKKYVGRSRARAVQKGRVYTVSFGMGREKSFEEYAEEFVKDSNFVQEFIKELEQESVTTNTEPQ
jgi:hypothetical protein